MANNRNRLHNCTNPYQGKSKRVLCLCSAGLLRSPTTAEVLTKNYGYNTRAAGVDPDHALIPVDEVLVQWADEIVCMTQKQGDLIDRDYPDHGCRLVVLDIADDYAFRDPDLILQIVENYKPE